MDPITSAPRLGRRWLVLIPVASIMYMLAFLDRTNISFVLPYMGEDLDLTNADKGLISGIFFIGYLILQVPAALLAQRWSAKYTIMILMVLWGLAAISSGLVQNSTELLISRFVLGVFEGGVQPATLVMLAMWFPQRERARANGFWLLCIPLSAVIAAPLTGMLLEIFDWRTVLIIEGVPPILWAIVWFFIVADTPSKARWMSTSERTQVTQQLAADEKIKEDFVGGSVRYRDTLRNPKVLLLVLAWFLYCAGFYGFTMWLPQVITTLTGGSAGVVGWLTAIPYALGFIAMIIVSVRTDKYGSRKFSAAGPLIFAAIVLVVGQFIEQPVLQFVLLCAVASGLYIHGAFFALPPLVLRTEVLAVAIGLIGGLGNLGGFVGPYVVGWLIDVTGNEIVGFSVMAAALLGSGIALAAVTPNRKIIEAQRARAAAEHPASAAEAVKKTSEEEGELRVR